MEYTLETVTTQEGLDALYNSSAFTFVGFSLDQDNMDAFMNHIRVEEDLLRDGTTVVSVIKGKTMNDLYNLSNSNRYPNDLNLVAIDLKYFKNVPRLSMLKMEVNARWFDDIVNNNTSSED